MNRKTLKILLAGLSLVVVLTALISVFSGYLVDYGGTVPPLAIHGQLTTARGEGVAGKEVLLLVPRFMEWRDAVQGLAAKEIKYRNAPYESILISTDVDGKFECTFPKMFRRVGGKETFFPIHHYSGAAPDEWNCIQVIVALAEKPADFVLIRHFRGDTSIDYFKPGNGKILERPADQRSLGVSVKIVRQSSHDTMELSLTLLNR
jgi:hypothetical protein